MNKRNPHNIITAEHLANLPTHERRKYQPITEEDAATMEGLGVAERAEWLGRTPEDELRINRAEEKRARKKAIRVMREGL